MKQSIHNPTTHFEHSTHVCDLQDSAANLRRFFLVCRSWNMPYIIISGIGSPWNVPWFHTAC